MSYIKKTWVTGEVVTAAKLNNMEDGIAEVDIHSGSASNISYDNTASGLTADDVQGAIDELSAEKADADDVEAISDALPSKLTEPSSGLAVGKYFRIASIDEDGHTVLDAVDAPSGGDPTAKVGSTAPTTSTAADFVGQLYLVPDEERRLYQNNPFFHIYVCTAIDGNNVTWTRIFDNAHFAQNNYGTIAIGDDFANLLKRSYGGFADSIWIGFGTTGAYGGTGMQRTILIGRNVTSAADSVAICPNGGGNSQIGKCVILESGVPTAENQFFVLGEKLMDNGLIPHARMHNVKTTLDAVAVAGAEYFLDEQSVVSIVLPSTAEVGQEISVVWYNGSTAATLSITGTTIGSSYTPTANTRSKVVFEWDGTNWAINSSEIATT